MADFAHIQAQFDNDPALVKRFLSDPVGVLNAHGVQLTPQQAFGVQQAVSEVTQPNSPATEALSIRVGVTIGIVIRF
jgi:hypothetical protein